VINPPAANKHGYWTNDARPDSAGAWLDGATRHDGSWWPHWVGWLGAHRSGKQVAARRIEGGIEPAPGSYAKAD
jgi:polyhydroxyalkanoate synthase